MKVIVLTSLFIISMATNPFNSELDKRWEIFKTKFNKNYGHDEEISRRLIWERNVDLVSKHNLDYNLGVHSYYLKIHQYSDMSYEEIMATMTGLKRKENSTNKPEYTFMRLSNVVLPDNVDWRKEGYVTRVKNQIDCGSCWAFSATGALEGQHKRKTGKLVSLSEQNLVDCSQAEGNQGCNGGWPYYAFMYVKHNGGIDTEKSYPYEAKDNKCRFKRETVGATCSGYVNITEGDEEALKQAVAAIGPISVAIDVTYKFINYGGGIFDDIECQNSIEDLAHGVLVVGYGIEDDIDYWLVKNSWGPTWGIKGYIKMSRNMKNQCGIATLASYPLM